MNRRFATVFIAVCFILTLGQGVAAACGHDSECDVAKECTTSERGITCTITAKGETSVDELRKSVRARVAEHHQMEGVDVAFNDVEGGIQVVMTATSDEAMKALKAHHDGCCAKADTRCKHAEKAANSDDCHHGEADKKHEDCSADCSKDCAHAKAAAETHDHDGCSHHEKS